jgi:hypothetical protein
VLLLDFLRLKGNNTSSKPSSKEYSNESRVLTLATEREREREREREIERILKHFSGTSKKL